VEELEKKRELYEGLAKRMKSLLSELLTEAELDFMAVDARVKTSKSIRLKLEQKHYSDPLAQLTDFCGVRVIAYDLGTLRLICRLIEHEFNVDRPNSGDKRDALGIAEFGYQSVHFIVSFSEDRLQLKEYHRYRGLKAEIQVRTVVQHAWAVINHKVRYKRPEEMDSELARDLNRCAALLEEADKTFHEAILSITKKKGRVVRRIERGDYKLAISFDSLETYVMHSPVLRNLTAIALNCGYCPAEQLSAEHSERRLWGAKKMCDHLRLHTLKQLDDYLHSAVPWAGEWFQDLKIIGAKKQLEQGIVPSGEPLSVLRHMLIGHLYPSLTEAQLADCACSGAVYADLVEARHLSRAGRVEINR
jgi:ppGpp synthetase/RelA/SpoT-type nucleotidyltranferase